MGGSGSGRPSIPYKTKDLPWKYLRQEWRARMGPRQYLVEFLGPRRHQLKAQIGRDLMLQAGVFDDPADARKAAEVLEYVFGDYYVGG